MLLKMIAFSWLYQCRGLCGQGIACAAQLLGRGKGSPRREFLVALTQLCRVFFVLFLAQGMVLLLWSLTQ